ncbi:hypothetical protein ACFL5F_03220 [Planctomycetota bacterium]
MSQKRNRKILAKPSSYIDVLLGSEVQKIAAVVCGLSYKYGIDPKLLVQRFFFDWQSSISCNIDGILDVEIESIFGPEDFIEAKLPRDKESLKVAEDMGDLWPKHERWHLNPGSIGEEMGAGGDQRLGYVFALINKRVIRRRLRKLIQKAIDHARLNEIVLEGMDESQISARVVIKMQFSTVGATGSGSMHWFLGEDGIRSCAKADGVESNLVLQIICRGNLETVNNEKADLNECIGFKHVYALSSGAYKDPLTQKIQPVACDALFLASNQNCNGNMMTLDQLLTHQGHCDYFLYHSPAGAKMRERLTDILVVKYDVYGDPHNVLTISCAFLSRDSNRVNSFCKYKAARFLANAAAAEGNIEKVRQYAVGLARQSSIVESDEDNQITSIVIHPGELGYEDVVKIAIASFMDRIGGPKGMEKAIAIDHCQRSMQEGDIPKMYKPCMRKQAQIHVQAVIAGLEKTLERIMRTSYGLWEAEKLYACLRSITDKSLQALMEKANEPREFLRPHQEIIAEASEQVDKLQQSNRLNRIVNYPLIQRLSSSLEASGRAVIGYQLQIAACEIAISDILTPLIDYLDRRLAWLSGMRHKLTQVAQICENKANSEAAKPTILNVPLGIELTTPEYLNNYFQGYVDRQGGGDKFTAYLLSLFLTKHGSLAFLADASLEEYEEAFTAVCENVFRPDIENTDVIGEFKRLYPDKNKQRRIIRRLIKQSEGCLRTTGEVNKTVPWLKGANVSSSEHADWLREMLDSVDKKQGKWEVAVNNDHDRIAIAQLRGGISLKPFIERVAPPDNPEGWARIIDQAPDPISVLIVMPNPNQKQFKRVLTKAIINGHITVNEKGYYVLSSSSGQSLILGKTFESVEAALQPKWAELVFIESTFGCKLVTSEEQILSKLNAMKEDLKSSNPISNPLLSLIDLTAMDECLIQVDLMLPRLRRIRKTNQKRLSS